MTQHERDTLVERYLGGEMNPSQESEFFLQVALDDELQRTLKAYRIIDSALEHERESAVPQRAKYRQNVMGLLAVTQVASIGGAALAGSGVSSAAASAGSAAGAGSALLTGMSLGLKALLATLLGASLVVGTLLVVDAVNPSDDAVTGGSSRTEQNMQLKSAPLPPSGVTAPDEVNQLPAKDSSQPVVAAPSNPSNTSRSSASSKVRAGDAKNQGVSNTEVDKHKKPEPITLPMITNRSGGTIDVKKQESNSNGTSGK